jgi:hypothetical protein
LARPCSGGERHGHVSIDIPRQPPKRGLRDAGEPEPDGSGGNQTGCGGRQMEVRQRADFAEREKVFHLLVTVSMAR